MNEEDLRLQIKRLAFRLQRIERHVGIEPADVGGDAVVVKGGAQSAPAMSSAAMVERSVEPVAVPPAQPVERSIAAPPTAPPPRSAPAPSVPSREPLIDTTKQGGVRGRPRKESDGSIESAIGIKVLGGIGAILVVIGAAFMAREFGANIWFSLPAWLQAMSIACFGGLLLLCGELALRRLGKPASLGLYGAGLGVLYMDAFATFQWFEIVSPDASFLLMGLVAACGFAITLRTKFLSIGVLSLIGGYLAPLLLWRDAGGGMQVLAFLTMLAGIALALSAWQPRPFRPLRYVAFGFQCFLGLIVVVEFGSAAPIVIVIFASLWWTMFTADAVFAAMRRQSSTGNVVVSLLGTAAYVTCTASILNFFTAVGSEYLGAFTAMIAVLCGAAALHFGPGLDGLRGRLDTAMDKLAVALWAQMGVLVTIALAMQFDGFGPSVGWLALGLASIEIGRRLPSSGVTVFGLIVGGLGVARILTLDQIDTGLQAILWSADQLRIDQWSLLALLAIAALHLAARRIGGSRAFEDVWPTLIAAIGSLGWLGLTALKAESVTLTALWLAGGVVLLLTAPLGKRERYLEIAVALLIAACGMWLYSDAFAHRATRLAAQEPVIFNLRFGMGALLIGVLAVAAKFGRRSFVSDAQQVTVRAVCMAMIAVIAFALGTMEIDHAWIDNTMARQAAWSMYWAVFGVALVLIGFVRLSAACRYAGLALLFVTIVKVLAFDMQNVDQVWRILSLIVSGLLLIATSMAYAKLSPKLLATLASRTHGPAPAP